MKIGVIEAESGETIYDFVARVKYHERNSDFNGIIASFNGIEFRVFPTSHEYDLIEKYNLLSKIRRLKAGYNDD